MIAVALAGCVETTQHVTAPPRIEGDIKNVSHADIKQVIALAEREMMQDYHRIFPINWIRVAGRNHIQVDYWPNPQTERWTEFHRIHGVWSPPTTEQVIVNG